ncbi:hypothetical protein [Pseudochrobactrum sp. MP213Fo]|uniref:hypothetical protein n=1 Tax=Pseudochrobactrum sp. MP213Fo TaxID=3022250 RepID=UPI003BA24163
MDISVLIYAKSHLEIKYAAVNTLFESKILPISNGGNGRMGAKINFLICMHASACVVLSICFGSDIVLNTHNVSMAVIFLLRVKPSKDMQSVIFHAAIARKANFNDAG